MARNRLRCLGGMCCVVVLVAACGAKPKSGETDTDVRRAAAKQQPPEASSSPVAAKAFGKPLVYNFDDDAPGKPLAHFRFARTGQGTEGTWVVQPDPTAPSKPNVLAQTSTDTTDYRFPLAILEEGSYRDVAVMVKFKAVSGKVDQAAGIVFRYQDPNNYYIVRANALENNHRLYQVVAGQRRQFAGVNLRVTPNQWHTLRVEAVSNQIRCYYDGELKISATDDTFLGPGKVGVWTKADSVTYFDDFEVSTPP